MNSVEYRPVSGLAVAAAATGAVSVVSLLGPALWLVPLVGIVLSIAALIEIGREGSVKVGRVPALIGLALAVGFLVQAMSHRAVEAWIVRARAETAAREFVRAARESRLADARDMCGPTALPASRVRWNGLSSGTEPPGGGEASDDSAFAALPAVAMLARCAGSAEATVVGEPPPEDFPAAHAFLVTVPCRAEAAAGEATGVRVRVVVERADPSGPAGGLERWSVVRHEVVALQMRAVE